MSKSVTKFLWPLLLLVAGCSHETQKGDVLARVDDKVITVDDFVQRTEFSPEWLTLGKELSKRELLDALIDEKLLAIEAEKRRMDQTPEIRQLTQFVEDLAVMRALFKKEVQSHVRLDPAQVEQAIAYSQQERKISWLSFKDQAMAQRYRQKWRNASLQEIIKELGGEPADTLHHQRIVKWGQNDPDLEAAIFNLQAGAISPVLEQNGAFVIIRCDKINQNAVATETNYVNLKTKVKRILAARRETQLSREYVSRFMQHQNVKFDEKRVRQIIDTMIDLVFSEQNSMVMNMMEIPVSESVWQRAVANLSAMQDEELVRFKNGGLSVGEFLARWRAYRFPVDKTNRAVCARSLNDQFSLVIRDVLLIREGRRRGLEKEPSVQQDKSVWQDFYLAERVAADAKKDEISSLLAALRKKSAISVNENLLQKVELTAIPVIALRPGQYASRVTPPWPAIMQKRIE